MQVTALLSTLAAQSDETLSGQKSTGKWPDCRLCQSTNCSQHGWLVRRCGAGEGDCISWGKVHVNMDPHFLALCACLCMCTVWYSEIGSLMSLDVRYLSYMHPVASETAPDCMFSLPWPSTIKLSLARNSNSVSLSPLSLSLSLSLSLYIYLSFSPTHVLSFY